MRRVISFLVASGLFGIGFVLPYLDRTSAIGFRGIQALMGGFLMAVGCAWLWVDFGPRWKIRPSFSPRAKYRGEVLERVGTIMVRDGTFPGLDETTDVAFNEQWPADETAVLYAGNVFAREIEELPNAERDRIAEHIRVWLSEPNSAQFDALRIKSRLGEPGAEYGDFLQWRVQWALGYVRRLCERNDINQANHDWFVSRVSCHLSIELPPV
jgi:hypothetical protein